MPSALFRQLAQDDWLVFQATARAMKKVTAMKAYDLNFS